MRWGVNHSALPQGLNAIALRISRRKIRSQRSRVCTFDSMKIVFVVLKPSWKHHKSKDWNFLHRMYTPQKIQLRKNIFLAQKKNVFCVKKNGLFLDEKIFDDFGRNKNSPAFSTFLVRIFPRQKIQPFWFFLMLWGCSLRNERFTIIKTYSKYIGTTLQSPSSRTAAPKWSMKRNLRDFPYSAPQPGTS